MKKLASLFVALFSLVWLTGAGWLPLAKSSGGPVYVFRDIQDSQVGSNTATYTVDIGTASAGRLVVVALASQVGAVPTVFTVNGTNLTKDVGSLNASTTSIWSALVASGSGPQSIVLTYSAGASFNAR